MGEKKERKHTSRIRYKYLMHIGMHSTPSTEVLLYIHVFESVQTYLPIHLWIIKKFLMKRFSHYNTMFSTVRQSASQ